MSTSSHAFDAMQIPAVVPLSPQDPAVTSEVYAEVARLGLGEDFSAAIALTRELFGDFAIRISVDPEISRCSYVTFKVRSKDTMDRVLEKESEWIHRVNWPAQAEGSFCLDVDFVE